jgi:hypothetical protein
LNSESGIENPNPNARSSIYEIVLKMIIFLQVTKGWKEIEPHVGKFLKTPGQASSSSKFDKAQDE